MKGKRLVSFLVLLFLIATPARADSEIPTVNFCTNPNVTTGCAAGSGFLFGQLPGTAYDFFVDADWESAGGDFERVVVNVFVDPVYMDVPLEQLQTDLPLAIENPFSAQGDPNAETFYCDARGTGGDSYGTSDYLIICGMVSGGSPIGDMTVYEDEEMGIPLSLRSDAPNGNTVIAFSGWNVAHSLGNAHILASSPPIPLQSITINVNAPCAPGDDDDGDGYCNSEDNCTLIVNNQRDDDDDGYGNLCDTDVTQDCVAGGPDLVQVFGNTSASPNPDSGEWEPRELGALDINQDMVIGGPDLVAIFGHTGLPPGPSGRACAACDAVAGTGVCPE